MLTRKTWTTLGFIAAAIAVSVGYQNCNSGVTRMSSVAGMAGVTAQEASGTCASVVKSWQVGSASCSAATPAMSTGMNQILIDNSAPSVGTASVRCLEGGVIELATDLPQTCQIQSTSVTNGECGSLNATTVASVSQPTPQQLCRAGNPTIIMGTGPWTWSCVGIGTGSTGMDCRAELQGTPPSNGVCGSSHGQTLTAKPTSGLCNPGNPSVVSGSGPWTWTCVGTGTGSTSDSCMASLQSTGGGGGGGSQAPQCGAASVGSRGYTSLSEFTANDYCFTGGSTPINIVGGTTGPWAWTCKNADGRTSDLCKAMKSTNPSCSDSGVKVGSKYCTQKYGETAVNCGSCIPTVCDTGYQITGSPAYCETLNRGSCDIPAGIMKIRAQSTAEYLSCEKTMTAQSVSTGSTINVSCANSGFGAVMAMKCLETPFTRATDNGGAAFNFKQLYYRHGRINNNDLDINNWAYAVVGARSGGYIFDENIAREITYNFSCPQNTDYSISSWNYSGGPGIRIQGTNISPRSTGSKQIRCLTADDENLYVVTIQCDGQPDGGPVGFWKILSLTPATPVAGQSKCTGGGKTADYSIWTPN